MPINETDLIPIRLPTPTAADALSPKMSASQVLPAGRSGVRPISDLRDVLGLPAAPQNTIALGISTLAITDGTNVAASVAGPARFQRIGNTVFVSGSLTVDPTAGDPTATDLNIALPIASTLAAATELSGTIIGNGGADVGTIVGDAGTNDALAAWSASHTDVQTYTYQFSYEVI